MVFGDPLTVARGPTYGHGRARVTSHASRSALALACALRAVAASVAGRRRAEQRAAPSPRRRPTLMPVEPYAGYQPQTKCRQRPKPGVLMLADWLVARGGGYGPISRAVRRRRAPASTRSRGPSTGSSTPAATTDQALAAAMLDESSPPTTR